MSVRKFLLWYIMVGLLASLGSFKRRAKERLDHSSQRPTRPLKSCCFSSFLYSICLVAYLCACVWPLYDLHKSRDCLCDLFGSLPSLPHLSQIVFELSQNQFLEYPPIPYYLYLHTNKIVMTVATDIYLECGVCIYSKS